MKTVPNTLLYFYKIPKLKDGWRNYQVELKRPLVLTPKGFGVERERDAWRDESGKVCFYKLLDTKFTFDVCDWHSLVKKYSFFTAGSYYLFYAYGFCGIIKFSNFDTVSIVGYEATLPRCYVVRNKKIVLLPNQGYQKIA